MRETHKMARKKKEPTDPMIAVLANIEKMVGNKNGKPKIFKYGDVDEESREVKVISFGYPQVNEASHIGGAPRGKLIEIWGYPSAGKSVLSLNLIGEAQKEGLKCILVDVEQSFDPNWAAKQGVDVNELYLMNEALTAEKALDYVNAICASGAFALVVVDSTAALVPKKQMEGSVEDQDYALLARAMSKACPKFVMNCARTETTCVFINQIREDCKNSGKGGEVKTCGGNALPFYAHMRLSVWPGGVIKSLGKDGIEQAIAKKSHITFMKNKTAVPYGKCIIEIVFDETAMNPVVKLVTLAKSYKLFNIRTGDYGISAEFIDDKVKKEHGIKTKFYNTSMQTFGELAHWVLANGYFEDVLWKMKDLVEQEEDEDKLKLIDPLIYELIKTEENDGEEDFTEKHLWESPVGDYSEPTDFAVCKTLVEESEEKGEEKGEEVLENAENEGIVEEELDLE